MAVIAILPFQIIVGTLANVLLFFYNVSRPRPTQVIFCHLAVANVLLLTTGIPLIMVAFVSRHPRSSLGCQVVYYINHVAHSAVLCSTCVLSAYQAFTLIPGSGRRVVMIGRQVLGSTGHTCCACWVYSTLISTYLPSRLTGPQYKHNHTHPHNQWFCSSLGSTVGFVFLLFVSNAIFIGLVGWASGSVILLLHRHHKRQQQIHTSSHCHRGSPETRAAYTVLMLVVTFVFFHTVMQKSDDHTLNLAEDREHERVELPP
ncbi:PREDICTED: vomeronasal type-1 receptor 4-like [Dipodomys ordii]|uniref:Vomeronasal type-1 receptor n=1 Tax=Dipodomys ordii TaxID=10020 RepID=A0A1S3GPR4_DIPOR|nr:PREDICTED: vomeronasal type-1 receptor 4-like [Dipodomys ordii]